jgi:hypothetical protein
MVRLFKGFFFSIDSSIYQDFETYADGAVADFTKNATTKGTITFGVTVVLPRQPST